MPDPDPNPNPKPIKRRFFLCTGKCVDYDDLYKHPQSHILGELRYLTDEGRQVTALALYETVVRADQVPPLKPVIRVYLIGDARMIKCGFPACENIQRWEIGKAAFEQLMKRYQKEDTHEPVTGLQKPTESRLSLEERFEKMEAALEAISAWGDAYPLIVFPEPDFKKVRELLEAGGVTLDSVSASNMRHVVEGVAKIAREGLGEE